MLFRFVVAIVSIVIVFSGAAVAQGDSEAAARDAFKSGVKLFRDGRYGDAAEAFREAYALKPNWKLLYNIGQTEAAAKRYGLALDAFEEYLSEGGDDVPQERQEEVMTEVGRLRGMIGFLVVEGLDGDVVYIDDFNRGELPRSGKIRVAMGRAKLRVVRGGSAILEQEVEILGGETTSVSVLEPKQLEEPGAPAQEAVEENRPADSKPADGAGKKRVWTWIAGGVGAAAGIAGGIIGGISIKEKNDFMDECGDDTCPASKESDRERIKKLSVTADVLYGVAAAGIITGIVLFFVEPGLEEKQSAVTVAPTALGNGLGISASGRF